MYRRHNVLLYPMWQSVSYIYSYIIHSKLPLVMIYTQTINTHRVPIIVLVAVSVSGDGSQQENHVGAGHAGSLLQ